MNLSKKIQKLLSNIDKNHDDFFEIVKVGDFVDSDSDRYYLCGIKYMTENKLYEVKEVDIRKDETGKIYSKSVIVHGDYQEHKSHKNLVWLSPSKVIYRNEKLIWESNLQKSARLCLEAEPNLSQDQIEKLQKMIFK